METIKGLIKSLINGGIGLLLVRLCHCFRMERMDSCYHWLYPWMVIAFKSFGKVSGKVKKNWQKDRREEERKERRESDDKER